MGNEVQNEDKNSASTVFTISQAKFYSEKYVSQLKGSRTNFNVIFCGNDQNRSWISTLPPNNIHTIINI